MMPATMEKENHKLQFELDDPGDVQYVEGVVGDNLKGMVDEFDSVVVTVEVEAENTSGGNPLERSNVTVRETFSDKE